jgi:prepilin-type N-terminal cleavage/methylation domain-containing protein
LVLPAGFTLLEVLMALALTGMVMVAVFAALDLSIRMSQAAPDSLYRHERATALLHSIERDLLQVEPIEAALPQTLGSTPRRPLADSRIVLRPPLVGGVIGGHDWIAVRVVPPVDPLRPVTKQLDPAAWVLYATLEEGRIPALSPRLLSDVFPSITSSRSKEGVIRSQAEDTQRRIASAGSRSEEPALTELLTSELQSTFRYFDGQIWHEAWNSRERNALPIAVEVTLQEPSRGSSTAPDKELSAPWRLHVSLADHARPLAINSAPAASARRSP